MRDPVKKRAADARYAASDKGRAASARYEASAKGRAKDARYLTSAKGREVVVAWRAAHPLRAMLYTARHVVKELKLKLEGMSK